MSKKFEIDLYSQLELNNVAFRRDGRIEAQCALDEGFSEAPAENGMLLAVDKANGLIKLPVDGSLPIALNYSAEHMYDESKTGLKNFCLRPKDGCYPRMGYLSVGDLFTTNCLCYNESDFASESVLEEALGKLGETAVYGGADASGRICLAKTKPTYGPVLKAVKFYTMPNGESGVKFQVIG